MKIIDRLATFMIALATGAALGIAVGFAVAVWWCQP
jgi:hypothetical protein